MTELAQQSTGYEVVEGEPPEVLARNLTVAGQLLASATAFFFLSFVFAYFYLRSLNNNEHVEAEARRRLRHVGDDRDVPLRRERHPRPLRARGPSADRRAAWRHEGCRRARVRDRRPRAPGGRVDAAGIRPRGRRVCQRVLRLDGISLPVRPRDDALARDDARDVVPVPRPAEGRCGGAARARVRRPGPDGAATSATRSRSTRRSSWSLSFYWTFLAGIAVLSWIILYLV